MARYVPVSIEKVGLEPFLDSKKTRHNGFGYREFKTMVEANVNLSNIAKAFNVSRLTVVKWMKYFKHTATQKAK